MVPMVDLGALHAELGDELRSAVDQVVRGQAFILGPPVERFERSLAEYLGVEHAIAVKSGSDALLLALLALGIGPGDEVVTTPFTFFATAGAVVRAGATPIFADVRPDTLALDPGAAARAIGPRTRAILAVHLFGQPADLAELSLLSAERGVALVEDTAQALGARFGERKAGTFGRFGCFSFHPSKPLGAFGDAGALATGDAELAERARRLRVHGALGKYEHLVARGGNHRLDALQAAVLSVKLPHLDRWLARRRAHARAYDEAFDGIPELALPARVPGTESSTSAYTLRVAGGRRDSLRDHLTQLGIESAVHYPKPLHLQPAFAALGQGEGTLPVAEAMAQEVLSIPVFPELDAGARAGVIAGVRSFFGLS